MEMDKIFSGVKLKSKQFCCGDKTFKIDYSDDLDAIIDQMTNEQFEQDERFPYFFAIWDSGVLLAEYILKDLKSLKGKTVLELGAGTGISGIALALNSDCRVIFTDYEEYSCRLCRHNCEINNLHNFDTVTADWRDFPEINENIDIVICSDVLYEKKQVVPLFNVLNSFLQRKIPVYLADPGRAYIGQFLQLVKDSGYSIKASKEKDVKENKLLSETNIYVIENQQS
jgi:predicted nicotinamide N-methyase